MVSIVSHDERSTKSEALSHQLGVVCCVCTLVSVCPYVGMCEWFDESGRNEKFQCEMKFKMEYCFEK